MAKLNNTNMTLSLGVCKDCGQYAHEYRSYETVMFRICPNGHTYVDIKQYSLTSTRHQKAIAELEPIYSAAFYASKKREKAKYE